jgi:hypothetical protein
VYVPGVLTLTEGVLPKPPDQTPVTPGVVEFPVIVTELFKQVMALVITETFGMSELGVTEAVAVLVQPFTGSVVVRV